MIKNKEDYKSNKEVYFILTQLEKAHANKDNFSASVLLTRLANIGLKLGIIDNSATTHYAADDIPF